MLYIAKRFILIYLNLWCLLIMFHVLLFLYLDLDVTNGVAVGHQQLNLINSFSKKRSDQITAVDSRL